MRKTRVFYIALLAFLLALPQTALADGAVEFWQAINLSGRDMGDYYSIPLDPPYRTLYFLDDGENLVYGVAIGGRIAHYHISDGNRIPETTTDADYYYVDGDYACFTERAYGSTDYTDFKRSFGGFEPTTVQCASGSVLQAGVEATFNVLPSNASGDIDFSFGIFSYTDGEYYSYANGSFNSNTFTFTFQDPGLFCVFITASNHKTLETYDISRCWVLVKDSEGQPDITIPPEPTPTPDPTPTPVPSPILTPTPKPVLVIPSNVTVIEAETFAQDYGILEVYIPKSVKEIQSGAFANCCELEAIHFEDGDDIVVAEDFLRGCVSYIRIDAPEGSAVYQNRALYKSYCQYSVPVQPCYVMLKGDSQGLDYIPVYSDVDLENLRGYVPTKTKMFSSYSSDEPKNPDLKVACVSFGNGPEFECFFVLEEFVVYLG